MIKSDLLGMKTCVGNALFLFMGEHFIWVAHDYWKDFEELS